MKTLPIGWEVSTSDSISRRVTVLDLMLLVGSTAVGLAAARFTSEYETQFLPERVYPESFAWFALASSVGLIPLFLKRPGPPLARIAQQPGFIASVTVALVFVYTALVGLPTLIHDTWWPADEYRAITPFRYFLWEVNAASDYGHAVAACWICQVLSGGWRAEPNLPDRLGRFWGFNWILLGIAYRLCWSGTYY